MLPALLLAAQLVAAPAAVWTRYEEPMPSPRAWNGCGLNWQTSDIVCQGGREDLGGWWDYASDVYLFSSGHWREGYSPTPPAITPKAFPSWEYDPRQHGFSMFGGVNCWPCGANSTREHWGYDMAGGDIWTLLSRPPCDVRRHQHVAAYDPTRSVLVIYGGLRDREHLRDTWELTDAMTWKRGPLGPSARNRPSMAYDFGWGQVLLFGGQNLDNTTNQETWTYTAKGWRKLAPATSPPGRHSSAMASDLSRRRLVLFGGDRFPGGPRASSDTWEWDGKSWRNVTTVPRPAGRAFPAMASDPRGGVFMSGGLVPFTTTFFDDAWRFAAP